MSAQGNFGNTDKFSPKNHDKPFDAYEVYGAYSANESSFWGGLQSTILKSVKDEGKFKKEKERAEKEKEKKALGRLLGNMNIAGVGGTSIAEGGAEITKVKARSE